jgi:hypothetical protein
MGHVPMVQVEEVGRVMIRFKDRKVFLVEVAILVLSTMKGEQKRIIRIIRVQKVHRTEIEDVIAWNGCEERVEKVVFLFVELRVMNAEYLVELCARPFQLCRIAVIDNDGE